MNLKQLAILGLAFTTFATSADAKPRKSKPKNPPVTLKTTSVKTSSAKNSLKTTTPVLPTTQTQCDYAVSQVFEPLYELLKKNEGTHLYAYMDSRRVLTCCTGIARTNPLWKEVVFRDKKTGRPLTKTQKTLYLADVQTTNTYAGAQKMAKKHGVYIAAADAKKLSYKTVKLAYGEMYKWAREKHGIDLLKEPLEIQLLVADLSYQLGYPKFQKKWPNFWQAIKTQNYEAVAKNCQTNEGNIDRKAIRNALAHCALAKKNGLDYTQYLDVFSQNGVGSINQCLINDPQGKILMAKALRAKETQKKEATQDKPKTPFRSAQSR